jgi:capsule polysaccharide export protein KpsE/RkpR
MNKKPMSESSLPDVGRDAAQECAAIEADLERLKAIVNDAAGRLVGSFNEFACLEHKTNRNVEERQRIEFAIDSAVTALQFQDIATQLAHHAQRRLAALETCLRALYAGAPGNGLLEHPQPVRQAEMSTGSVELF